jgi:hypothetical protein
VIFELESYKEVSLCDPDTIFNEIASDLFILVIEESEDEVVAAIRRLSAVGELAFIYERVRLGKYLEAKGKHPKHKN